MKLTDCTLGKVVFAKNIDSNSDHYGEPEKEYKGNYVLVGHIIGFELNCCNETIVQVKWNNGKIYSIHPAQLLNKE
jgi:hypothetical protein